MSTFDNISAYRLRYMQSYLAEPPARASTELTALISDTKQARYSHSIVAFSQCDLCGFNVMRNFNFFADRVNAVLLWLISLMSQHFCGDVVWLMS